MKKILKVLLSLLLVFSVSNISFARKKVVKRSASSASGLVSKSKSKSKSSASSKSSKKASSTSKKSKSSKKDKKDKDKDKDNSEDENQIPENEQCMIDNMETLLNGECKFLNSDNLSELSNGFYCLYNLKDKNKVDSVYNIYLYQNYATKEDSLKDNDATVVIKQPSMGSVKGASKYYESILDGLEDDSLLDGKIFDFLTEEILDSSETLNTEEIEAIQKISVREVPIAMNLVKSDIENCKKATKKVIQTCGIANDTNIQQKIVDNCQSYESILAKQASENKAKVLDSKSKLLTILLQRLDAIKDSEELRAEIDEKEVRILKKNAEIAAAKAEIERMNAENKTEEANDEEIKETSEEETKSDAKSSETDGANSADAK
ncbi:MAG: hypothetical protein J6J27_05655 [Alphaproteobacteria bacterium]|nr:hypothetical protein [Alphaproteobacteria bacterium]